MWIFIVYFTTYGLTLFTDMEFFMRFCVYHACSYKRKLYQTFTQIKSHTHTHAQFLITNSTLQALFKQWLLDWYHQFNHCHTSIINTSNIIIIVSQIPIFTNSSTNCDQKSFYRCLDTLLILCVSSDAFSC